MIEACRWQLLHITKGGRSVEDYTREFFRLLRHAPDVRDNERRAVDLFMTRLGSAYASMHTDGHNLERVIEKARMLERRHIRKGTISDPYMGSSSGYGAVQGF